MLFRSIGTPLPWTLGPLFVTALISMLAENWTLPRLAINVARPLVGVMAGGAFTLPVILAIPGWWSTIAALVAYSLLVTLLGRVFFRCVCGYDEVTSLFASAPGGLGELTLLGGSLGGDMRTLALVHTVRIAVVVLVVPFLVLWFLPEIASQAEAGPGDPTTPPELHDWIILASCAGIGFLIGKPLKTLGGVMLVPLLLSAFAHVSGLTTAVPPDWLTAAAQVLIGSVAGTRFAGTTWSELRTTIVHAGIWAVALLASAIAAAFLCSLLLIDQPLLALIMAFAPGGIVEITILAYAVGLNVSFIVTLQVCRVTLVLISTPAVFQALSASAARRSRGSGS